MFETMEKMMLAGAGALAMTRERAERIFDEYVKRGQVEKEARTGFVKEMMDAADKTRGEMEKMIRKQIDQAVEASQLATREDLRNLEAKIEALESALNASRSET